MANMSANKIITTHRGDTFKFPVSLNIGSIVDPVYIDMALGDYLYFAVMEPNQKFEDAIIKKAYSAYDYDFDNACVMIRFNVEDTEFLIPGTYYYEIRLFRDKKNVDDKYNAVDTILPRTKFIILE